MIYLLLGGLLLLLPLFGIELLSPLAYMGGDGATILLLYRLPRVFTAAVCGGVLAVVGMVFQALFQNPLATPYTVGVAGGASLGAGIARRLGGATMIALGPAALLGGSAVALIVRGLFTQRGVRSEQLLLTGVVLSTITASLLMLFHYIGGERLSFQLLHWTMGSVSSVVGGGALLPLLPLGVVLFLLYRRAPMLDHLCTDEWIAQSRGVDLLRERRWFTVVSTLAVALVVTIVGPIGFIGILAPHGARFITPGATHQRLLTSTFAIGAVALALADTVARSLLSSGEIPVGIVTALLGGPLFLLLLIKGR